MNIKKTIITTAVALMTVAMIAPLAASAVTTMSGNIPTACVGVVFTRNLRVGSTGQDVQCFQALLNTHGYILATSGAGSPGMETMYFGPRTLASVQTWQAAQGWTIASQVGPLSRALFNSYLAGSANSGLPVGCTSTAGFSSVTGLSCATTTVIVGLPAGCTTTAGFSPVTGASCATGQVTQTGPVTAMLSSDNPPAGSIVGGQATADLLHITFTGSGTVTSVTLNRTGISDQNTLSNVYLYDGNVRMTDGYSFNINGQIVINGLALAVAGSHTISVRADVASAAPVTASTLAVSLTGYTANGSTSTSNIMGNTMFIVVGNLATSYLGANTTPLTANVNAGTTGYTFWSAPVQVNVRAVWLKGANFKMIGSAPSDALSNIKMFIDGVDTGKVGTVMAINGSNYAVFDLTSAPISLMTGSHTVDMRADIQKGTNRTVQVSVQQAADFTIFDPQVGVNIALLGPAGAAFNANSGSNVTINTGSVTVVIDPAFITQTNISGGSTNAIVARYKVHAYGEDVKVNSLVVTPEIDLATSTGGTCTTGAGGLVTSGAGTCGANNVTLYFNGSQVGSQQNWVPTSVSLVPLTFNLGSQMIAPAGQDSWLEVRMDLQTANSVNYTGGTVKVTLPIATTNGQGMSSQATIAVPTAAVATTGLTITTGGLQVSKNTAYLNQSIVPNTAGVKIGSYIIQNQSTSEAMRITSFSIATTTVTAAINNFSALRTSDTTGSGSTPIQPSGTTCAVPPCLTSTDTFSVNDTLAIGATMTVDIFANTGSATTGTITTTLNVSSIGAVDNISTTSGAKPGQTLTLGTGTLATPTLAISSTTPSQYIPSSATSAGTSQATFNFVSTSGASTITELGFVVSGSDATPTQTVTQVCVGAVCSSPVTLVVAGVSTGVIDMTNLNIAVQNATSQLPVTAVVSYSGVGTNGIVPSSTSTIGLAYIKYNTGSSPKTMGNSDVCTTLIGGVCTDTISAVNANAMTMVGSKPVLTVAAGGATGMILNTSTKVGQVTVTADARGGIQVRQINFAVGYSGYSTAPTSIASAFLAKGGETTAITGSFCFPVSTTNVVCGFHSADGVAYTYANDFPITAAASQQFDLYVTTGGGLNTGTNKASISTTLVNGASTSASGGTTSAFLWDDTSNNGGTGSFGLTGTLIYGFPLNGYSVSQ